MDGKVFLGAYYLRFSGIAILGNQVAGETGKLKIPNFLDSSLPTNDRFARAQSDNPDRYLIARKRL